MTTSTAPVRSLEQRLTALDEANRIRTYRANVKRDLKAGRVRWVDLLDHPDLQTMKLFDLLLATPKIGRVKAAKITTSCRVAASKTIGGLSDRQRFELLEAAGRCYPNTAGVRPSDTRRGRDRFVVAALEERAGAYR